MGRHKNTETGVVFSVSDEKDGRYGSELYGSPDEDQEPQKRGPGRPRKSE